MRHPPEAVAQGPLLKLTGDLETRTTQLLEWAAVGVGIEATLRLLPL